MQVITLFLTLFATTVSGQEKLSSGYGVEFRKQKDIAFGVSVVDIIVRYPVEQIVPMPMVEDLFKTLGNYCLNSTEYPSICKMVKPVVQKYRIRRALTSIKLHHLIKIMTGLAPRLKMKLPQAVLIQNIVYPNLTIAMTQQKEKIDFLAACAQSLETTINNMQAHITISEDKKHISMADLQPVITSENSAELAILKETRMTQWWSKMFPPQLCSGSNQVLEGELPQFTTLITKAFVDSGHDETLENKTERLAATIYPKEVFDMEGRKLIQLCRDRHTQIVAIKEHEPETEADKAVQKSKLERLITNDKTLIETFLFRYLDLKVKAMTAFAKNETVSPHFAAILRLARINRNNMKPITKSRPKRFLDLLSFGMSAYVLARNEQMRKAINALNKNTKLISENVEVLHGDMTALTTHVNTGMKIIHNTLEIYQSQVHTMMQNFVNLRDTTRTLTSELTKVSLQLFYLSVVRQILEPMLLKDQILQTQQLEQMAQLVGAMQILDQGRLPPYLLSPETVSNLINLTLKKLRITHPNVEPLLKDINEYYQQTLVRFEHDSRNLYIQIPLFIHDKNSNWYNLYKTRTVPVPMFGNNTNTTYFTQLISPKPYLAISDKTHVELDIEDIRDCVELGTMLICIKDHLEYDFTKQTCLSAIYRGAFTREQIKNLCDFNMVPKQAIKPQLLETDKALLLANIKIPWKLKCKKGKVPAQLLKQSYLILPRKTLCQCEIDTQDFILTNRPDACTRGKNKDPIFKFVINQAFVSYWPELSKQFSKDVSRLLENPPNVSIPDVNISSFSFPDVLQKDWQEYDLSLSTFADTVKKHELIWKDKSSKLHKELIDIKQGLWLPNPIKWMIDNWKIVSITWSVIFIVVVVVYFSVCCHCCRKSSQFEKELNKLRFHQSNTHNLREIMKERRKAANQMNELLASPIIPQVEPLLYSPQTTKKRPLTKTTKLTSSQTFPHLIHTEPDTYPYIFKDSDED